MTVLYTTTYYFNLNYILIKKYGLGLFLDIYNY